LQRFAVTVAPRARISIVIPSFNHGAYLEQAIGSVLNQEYPRVDLIVIDGGSTDQSRAVIERHGARLGYWCSEPDRGPADALNKGFARAEGDVLGFLNADDFLLPGALTAIGRAFAADPAADVISGNGYYAVPSGELALPAYSDPWDFDRFANGACVLLQPATYFTRGAFTRAGGFRASGRVCWDMELWADLARTGAVFSSVDAFLAAFRLHAESITGAAGMVERRRRDARAVMAEIRGGPETTADRLNHLRHRAQKFARHPVRAARQRLFFHRILKRWSP
jgi:glycosyltransferase involved in cell wall biosynthesis